MVNSNPEKIIFKTGKYIRGRRDLFGKLKVVKTRDTYPKQKASFQLLYTLSLDLNEPKNVI